MADAAAEGPQDGQEERREVPLWLDGGPELCHAGGRAQGHREVGILRPQARVPSGGLSSD